jgi:hypothetical protein
MVPEIDLESALLATKQAARPRRPRRDLRRTPQAAMRTAEGEGGAARVLGVRRMEIWQAEGFWDLAIFEIE